MNRGNGLLRSGFHLHFKQTLDFMVSLQLSWSDVLPDLEGTYNLKWRIIYVLLVQLFNSNIWGRFWAEGGCSEGGGGGKAATKLVACNDMYSSLCITKKGIYMFENNWRSTANRISSCSNNQTESLFNESYIVGPGREAPPPPFF